MAKQPLTKHEKDKLFRSFRDLWERRYAEALSCGALDESYQQRGDWRAAKYALVIAADGFRPFDNRDRKDYANLRKFV